MWSSHKKETRKPVCNMSGEEGEYKSIFGIHGSKEVSLKMRPDPLTRFFVARAFKCREEQLLQYSKKKFMKCAYCNKLIPTLRESLDHYKSHLPY